MVQPKKSPTSLRIPDATRAAVEQWAAANGVPKNAAFVEMIQRGLKAAGGAPRGPGGGLSVKTIQNARQGAEAVQIGPARAAPGSRLKGVKK